MSDKVKFDVEINKKFSDNIIINYGIVNGNNTIVFIKAGKFKCAVCPECGYTEIYIQDISKVKKLILKNKDK